MKPATLLVLLAIAIGVSVVVRVLTPKPEPFEPYVDLGHVRLYATGEVYSAQVEKLYAQSNVLWVSNSFVWPLRTNDEAQRIIGELVVAGFSPEDAAEVYRLTTEAAAEQRKSRPAFPGVRESIDTNRWPLFSEPASP